MFGKSRPKKLDSRIRFQHQSFTRKLDQQRHYKRQAQALPEETSYNILPKLGLRTWRSQTLALLILTGVVYLIFVPNFLSAQTITVQGAGDQSAQVEQAARDYMNNSLIFLAQHNIIFLNNDKLKAAILSNQQIYKVKTIKKDFWQRSLAIDVEMKAPRYVVNRAGDLYSIYNDGSVQERLYHDAAQWLTLNPGTIKVQDDFSQTLSPGTKYFSDELISALTVLQERFQTTTNQELDYFAIPSTIAPEPVAEETETVDTPEESTENEGPEEAGVEENENDETESTDDQSPISALEQKLPLQPSNLHIFVKRAGSKRSPADDIKIIVDAKQDMTEALSKLQMLFAQMAPDRYTKLVYIDLRFTDRAFLCLSGAACATSN